AALHTLSLHDALPSSDMAVNELLERRLRSATPDYGWLSEESADDSDRLDRSRVWIVDPIDGTRSFLASRQDWCVSVALVEDQSRSEEHTSELQSRENL